MPDPGQARGRPGLPPGLIAVHPLKLVCLLAWLALFACQLALLWPGLEVRYFWVLLLAPPLLLPLGGLLVDRLYTYKWIGFMSLAYFCIGISELFANPPLRPYALGTLVASTALFLGSIYYARYLRLRGHRRASRRISP